MTTLTPRPRRPAQALTELALVLPLLAMLLVGLIELGFLLHAHVQVSSAAREAARAASLYRSTRYATLKNLSNPTGCGTTNGWSLQQTVEQAVVYRALQNNGCPDPAGAVTYSALGRLDPARSTAAAPTPFACPTGAGTGWLVGVTPAFVPADAEDNPTAGVPATVTLCYPYRLIVLADMLRLGDPIWISKSVNFEYQQ
ncbi:MAG TPA: TadE/TadG family type IV pilus assembly protein [Chloroflexaceae bacterium]|nr:TadE/TadG family type IV pilus assembly protein [Chloroflexaceae bacterium]